VNERSVNQEATTWSEREVGSGVPMLPWECRRYFEPFAEYEGHAFVTCDPKHLGRSVCDGFVDDMEWITALHNRIIGKSWRARLARRLLDLQVTPAVEGGTP
jgi:hypothetical protein